MSTHYERLSAQDSSFLVFESPNTHMHVAGVAILEAGPLATPDGGIDMRRLREYINSRLPWLPRYRQRVAYTPIEGEAIWVDDDHFNLGYHVRHTSLPRPGDERQLKRLCARILSQQLDRGKPLWELWIVEGLADGRFAFVSKAHHCMVDGIAGVDLVSVLLSPTPEQTFPQAARWKPRPAPDQIDLLRDALLRRAQTPLTLARALRRALQEPNQTLTELQARVNAAWQLVGAGLRRPANTPLNQPIGPHRRLDWLTLDLRAVKDVKNRLGGTVNDVVLATVAGAVGRFLRARGVRLGGLDYRTVIPVSVRAAEEYGTMGNRVSAWITSLPIQQRDPRKRFTTVRETTTSLKDSKQALGVEVLTQVGAWAGTGLLTLGVRLASRLHPYNLVVTNVPGPQDPLYLLGARMLFGYPQVPLFENQGLGVALFSYCGQLCWGLNAERDLVPDLHDFASAIVDSFRELHEAATGSAATARRRA